MIQEFAIAGFLTRTCTMADGVEERIKKRIYKTRDLAKADVFDYIEMFYNQTRRHSHLGGVSPEAFERASF